MQHLNHLLTDVMRWLTTLNVTLIIIIVVILLGYEVMQFIKQERTIQKKLLEPPLGPKTLAL